MVDGLFAFGSLETVEVPKLGPAVANDASALAPLGILLRHNGKVFRYVKFDKGTDAIAAVAYGVTYWKTLTMPDPENGVAGVFTVTCDLSSAQNAGINLVAGVLGCVVTDGYYTWIQVGGIVTALCAASTVAGDLCVYGTDKTFGRNAYGSQVNHPYGVALSTLVAAQGGTASNTCSVLLQNLIW
jgi:hypothetical protein